MTATDWIHQRSRFGIQNFNTMHGTAASVSGKSAHVLCPRTVGSLGCAYLAKVPSRPKCWPRVLGDYCQGVLAHAQANEQAKALS